MEHENELVIDLTEMPAGERYEDRYGAYLEIFHQIAMSERKVTVVNPPWSWTPLLWYLGAWVQGGQTYFEHCPMVKAIWTDKEPYELDRTSVEVLCGFRPETTDALYKIDMQWERPQGRVEQMQMDEPRKEFIVTTNGSFHRPEVMFYLNHVLSGYTPKKKKVVLVPCAADKPYPAKLHQEVLKRMPEDYYLAIHTGVLGIVPQDLWPFMPHYDSGLPNEWRLARVLEQYFTKYVHSHVVVYADFYSLAIQQAFMNIDYDVWYKHKRYGLNGVSVTFVNPIKQYDDYLDLLAPERLDKLEQAFQKERQMV